MRGARAASCGLVALAVTLGCVHAAGEPPREKKLIEFGWDEPDTRFLRDHIAEMQATPFDGCVFHANYRTAAGDSGSFTWKLWSRRRFTDRDLAAARTDLQATKFGRFRESFLRVNVTPADLDWFEDHGAVMANLELAARLARLGGCPGILFDVESYEGKLWDYRALTRTRPRPWETLAARVRELGAQAMRALERGYPGLTVFTTFAYSMPLHESGGGRRPVQDMRYGLLVPFLDGMVSAASDSVVLVDGHEISYAFREPEKFAAKADSMRRGVLRLVADPERYLRRLSVGFGIWLDNDWQHLGWDARDPARNHHTPRGFGEVVAAAMAQSDRYVWIYTEKPRWWTAEGGPRELPAVYDSVLRSVRHGPRGVTP